MTNPKLYGLRERAQSIQSAHSQFLAEVRADRDLSEEGRARKIAATHIEVKKQLADLGREERDTLTDRRSQLERKLFGASGIGAGLNDGTHAISARDASERASQLGKPDEAAALLHRAEADGDEVLARAIARRCIELSDGAMTREQARQWDDVTRGYIDARPHLEPVVEELAEIETLTTRQIFSPFKLATPADVPQHVLNNPLAQPVEAS